MRPLGKRKHTHKCEGHGEDCAICVPVTKKDVKRLRDKREAMHARLGRAKEKERYDETEWFWSFRWGMLDVNAPVDNQPDEW